MGGVIHLTKNKDNEGTQRDLICRVKLNCLLKMFVSTDPTVGFRTGGFDYRPLREGGFDNSDFKRVWNEYMDRVSFMRKRHQPTDEPPTLGVRLALHCVDEPPKYIKRLTTKTTLVLSAEGAVVGPLRRYACGSSTLLQSIEIIFAPVVHDLSIGLMNVLATPPTR